MNIRSLKDKKGRYMDNIGAYLVACLGDMDVESALKEQMDITKFEAKEVEVEVDEKRQKNTS